MQPVCQGTTMYGQQDQRALTHDSASGLFPSKAAGCGEPGSFLGKSRCGSDHSLYQIAFMTACEPIISTSHVRSPAFEVP